MSEFTLKKLKKYKHKNIHIVGVAGTEGFAILEYLHQLGFDALTCHNLSGGEAMDKAFRNAHVALTKKQRESALLTLHKAPEIIHTDDSYLKNIHQADMIFATQNWFAHTINKPIAEARKAGITVHFLTQLYFDLSPAPIIAVTGTNGKTTVASLLYHILNSAKFPCLMSGNDRYHPQVLNKLDTLSSHGVLILEISNRQLKELKTGPEIAILTCIQPDHLDEHGSFGEYLKIKTKLFKLVPETGYSILNRQDENFNAVAAKVDSHIITYGLDAPKGLSSVGVLGNQIIRIDNSDKKFLFNHKDIPLIGMHNQMNCMAAATAASLLGVSGDVISESLRTFKGVKHRLEILDTINGSRFIDDEASTNPGATLAALNSMNKKVVLICGGNLKGNESDYKLLEPVLQTKAACIICLPGKAGELVAEAAVDVPVHKVTTLSEAMEYTDSIINSRFDLLLSPAGAGFHSLYNSGLKGFRRMVRDRRRLVRDKQKQLDKQQVPPTTMDSHIIPGTGKCWFKHEYLCPTGSHKDRAAIYQVRQAVKQGARAVIIPSSGNAAIAVSAAGAAVGLPVYAFLAPGTHPGKVKAMIKYKPRIIFSDKSLRRAENASRRFGFPNLRPSRDPWAVKGFMSLGHEIAGQDTAEEITDIFIFCTSGATLTGIAEAFINLKTINQRNSLPSLHAVQSGAAVDLARSLDKRLVPEATQSDSHKAGFGGVKGSRLTNQLIQKIRETNGSGWYISVDETREAGDRLSVLGIKTSSEGQAAFAAVLRWRQSGGAGYPLIILTGKQYPDLSDKLDLTDCHICRSKTYGGIETFISRWHTVKP
ncbi:UDP-N-acetylmuramoyl-L-alanine--D-glutamate ligase [bacterium]|nr:UDP-N-acetylmuramoyl-L-alanine--D-glutamate ligase [bacterium]